MVFRVCVKYTTWKLFTGDIVSKNNIYAKGNYLVYHTGNKPSASDVGALSANGGTLNGNLTVNGSINGANYIALKNTNVYLGNANVYLGYDGTTTACDYLRLGGVLWVNKGSAFYATNTAGTPAPIYSSNIKTSYSVDETETVSDISALDYIDNVNVAFAIFIYLEEFYNEETFGTLVDGRYVLDSYDRLRRRPRL